MRTMVVLLAMAGSLWMPAVSQARSCTLSDISIKSLDAQFVDICRTGDCYVLRGSAVLTNACPEATGVQVEITAYDRRDDAIATRDVWLANRGNIPTGDYKFSLDNWLDYEPGTVRFDMHAIRVHRRP